MHAYKSCAPEQLLKMQQRVLPRCIPVSLQTDEIEAHHRLELKPASHEWSNTLEQIGQCCAVFSVDTAVAHLAAGSERMPHHFAAGRSPTGAGVPCPRI